MRKEMNKGSYIKHRFYIISAVILFLAGLLFDFTVIRMEYINYQEKIQILCRMLSEKDMVDTAAGILKGYEDINTDEVNRNDDAVNIKEVEKDIKEDEIDKDENGTDIEKNGTDKIENETDIDEDVTDKKEDGIDKNEDKSEKEGDTGEKILKAYGYHLEKGNALYRDFMHQCLQIILFSVLFYILCTAAIWWSYTYEKKKRAKDINKLDALLTDYKNQEFNITDASIYHFENNDLEKLYSDILSLGDYLRLLNEKVSEEKEATKSLVTDISHQLKTPVAALKTSFEVLQREDLNEKDKKEFTDRCSLQLKGIENLLEALINISRLETGMIAIKLETANIFETILEAVNRVYLKAQAKEIQLEMDAEEELQIVTLPHDKKWLSEALINILDNAVKYSGENTCILIRMMKRTTFLRIEIEDQGIGIPKSEYNQIFKRFYRGNSREVKEQTGSGVGLYLTREIISRHKGTIRVSSGDKGMGSKFIIQLPYHL